MFLISRHLFIYLLIDWLIDCFSDYLVFWVDIHKASLVWPGRDLFSILWKWMGFHLSDCCPHSCVFCTSHLLSSIYSSLQLLIPTESGQGHLLPESLILCYLVSCVNHHDDVSWCFHHKLLLSFICLRRGVPVDFLPPVLMTVTFKNILIQHTVTLDLSYLHTLITFTLEFTNVKSWVG